MFFPCFYSYALAIFEKCLLSFKEAAKRMAQFPFGLWLLFGHGRQTITGKGRQERRGDLWQGLDRPTLLDQVRATLARSRKGQPSSTST